MVHGDLVYDKMFHKYCDVREYIGIGIVRVKRDERLADEWFLGRITAQCSPPRALAFPAAPPQPSCLIHLCNLKHFLNCLVAQNYSYLIVIPSH